MFCDRGAQPWIDANFRLLFLSLIEDLFPSPSGDRLLPATSKLAQGLDDPSAEVTYSSPRATREYPAFRAMIEDLCNSPIFQGQRAEQIRASIYPFDKHYENRSAATNVNADDRLGGYVTELSVPGPELAGKRLQLLADIVPGLARVAILSNPSNPSHGQALQQIQTAAQPLGVEIRVAKAAAPDKFDKAFATVIAARADALIVLADEMFFNNHAHILAFTDMSRLPVLFPKKEIAEAGSLMTYGPRVPAGPILRDANPADSPIELPTEFEFAINLKAARALGLTVPPSLLAIADEVIE
jgi:hypothetical protein